MFSRDIDFAFFFLLGVSLVCITTIVLHMRAFCLVFLLQGVAGGDICFHGKAV